MAGRFLKRLVSAAAVMLWLGGGLASPAQANEAAEIKRFFAPEEKNRHRSLFKVTGYADFKFAFGLNDGRYKLIAFRIKKLDENVYKLALGFRLKKGFQTHKETHITYFWYDGRDKMVFKDGDKKVVFDVITPLRVSDRQFNTSREFHIPPNLPSYAKVELHATTGTINLDIRIR